MQFFNSIFSTIKQAVKKVEPSADIILYGSYARGNPQKDSDIDLLILVNKKKNITIRRK